MTAATADAVGAAAAAYSSCQKANYASDSEAEEPQSDQKFSITNSDVSRKNFAFDAHNVCGQHGSA